MRSSVSPLRLGMSVRRLEVPVSIDGRGFPVAGSMTDQRLHFRLESLERAGITFGRTQLGRQISE